MVSGKTGNYLNEAAIFHQTGKGGAVPYAKFALIIKKLAWDIRAIISSRVFSDGGFSVEDRFAGPVKPCFTRRLMSAERGRGTVQSIYSAHERAVFLVRPTG
jgi:hypothetical protein